MSPAATPSSPAATAAAYSAMEARVCAALAPVAGCCVTPHDLFWLRFQVGEHYLFHHLCIPHSDAQLLLRDATFWGWWRSIWHIADLGLISDIEAYGRHMSQRASLQEYELLMRPRLYRYRPNRVVMAATLPASPVLDPDCPL